MADPVELPPKSALELQIEQEAKELAAVPKIPISQFTASRHIRCHICGQLYKESELLEFDTHIPVAPGMMYRRACPNCHPDR